MPRNTTRERTVRTAAPLAAAGNSPQLNVTRRNLLAAGRGNDQASRQAQALSNFVGAGLNLYGEVAEKRRDEGRALGESIARSGEELTDEQRQNNHILRGHTNVTARAEAIAAGEQLKIAYDQLTPEERAKMTPQDLQRFVSSFHEESWKGIDPEDEFDQETMRAIGPLLEEQELSLIALHQQKIEEQVQSELDASMKVSNQHALNTNSFDWGVINKQYFQIYQGRANEEIIEDLVPLLIQRGDVERLQSLQQITHWEGGAPAPGGINAYSQVLQNAVIQARGQRTYNENMAEKQDTEDAKEAADAIGQTIIASATGGAPGSAETIIITAAAAGTLDPEDARTWLNWTRAWEKSDTDGVVTDSAVYRQVILAQAQGQDTNDLIVDNAGSLSADDIATLTARDRAVQSALRSDPVFTSSVALVRSKFGVPTEILNEMPDTGMEQADKIGEFIDKFLASDDKSREAANKIIEELGEPTDWQQWTPDGEAATFGTRTVVRNWVNAGGATPADVIASYPSASAARDGILDLYESGLINEDQLEELEAAGGF